jgi:hypothetical protein
MASGGSFPGVKLPKLEADNSSPSTAVVKNVCSCNSTPPYNFMARSRANFYLFYSLVLSANVNSFLIPSSASLPTIFSDAMNTLVPQNTRQTIIFSNKAITGKVHKYYRIPRISDYALNGSIKMQR